MTAVRQGQCNQYLRRLRSKDVEIMNSNLTVPERLYAPKSAVTLRTVTADEAGQRIDNFLMRLFKTAPRSRVYRLWRKRGERGNRKRVDGEIPIPEGGQIRLPPLRSDAAAEPRRPSTTLL